MRLSRHNPRKEHAMRQGIVGLAMGVILGTVLAAGAAFALNTPNHVGATSRVTAAPVAATSMPVPSNTATGSTDATGSVSDGVREARHPIEKPHAKKVPHAKKKAHQAKHRSTRPTRSANSDAGHRASDGVNHAPRVADDRHEANHDGGACD